MKKSNKGTGVFVIGTVLYALILLLDFFLFYLLVSSSFGYMTDLFLWLVIALFLLPTMWFLSFTMSYLQRKSQIELLEEKFGK
jgi:ABC-type multidrug transport system permease subunit